MSRSAHRLIAPGSVLLCWALPSKLMIAPRGMMLWLPRVPIFATSWLLMFGLLLWWLVLLCYVWVTPRTRSGLVLC